LAAGAGVSPALRAVQRGQAEDLRTHGKQSLWPSELTFIECVFYDRLMAATEPDRITVSRITGAAHRHARLRPLTEAEYRQAVTELNEAAAGRADLLAQYAGVTVGFHEGEPDEALHLQAAQLCIDAGADTHQIPRWIEEGRHRAAIPRHR
jgi:hypothetical protein